MRVALLIAAALALGWAGLDAATTPSRASCAATVVRYQPAKHPTFHDTPWVLARPAARGVLGFVVTYPQSLRDRRVNRSDGLVLWQRGGRIVWSGPSLPATLAANRIDGKGAFRLRLAESADGLVSDLRFPSLGCWRLRVNGATVVVRVVSTPSELSCAATPIPDGRAFARPRTSGLWGGWGPWRTPSGGALLYTHGHGGGWNMKVLWQARRGGDFTLGLLGMRLDADGSFAEELPTPPGMKNVYPSNVDVPAAGCWLLRLRTGRLAGVIVVQAVDDRG